MTRGYMGARSQFDAGDEDVYSEKDLVLIATELLEALKSLTGLIRDCHNVYQNHTAAWIMRSESFKKSEAAIAAAKEMRK